MKENYIGVANIQDSGVTVWEELDGKVEFKDVGQGRVGIFVDGRQRIELSDRVIGALKDAVWRKGEKDRNARIAEDHFQKSGLL